MRDNTPNLKLTAVLVAAALPLVFPASAADSVYKCVVNGKTHYMSSPPAAGGDCKQTEILDDGPKPEDLARLLDEKKRKQEQERVANDAAIREREIRAKEIEAVAALRRARAEELQVLMQQQQPAYTQSSPFFWGGIIVHPLPPVHKPPSPPPAYPPLPLRLSR
jgi:hypothetical protein